MRARDLERWKRKRAAELDEVDDAIRAAHRKSKLGPDGFIAFARAAIAHPHKTRFFFHGTSEKNARSILRRGFRKGTYFTDDIASAIGYGGPHVFWVRFPASTWSAAGWQFRTFDEVVKPDRIDRHEVYAVTRVRLRRGRQRPASR